VYKTSTCKKCGKDFRYYTGSSSGNFCSKECRKKYYVKKITCKICGNIFEDAPSSTKICCSKECSKQNKSNSMKIAHAKKPKQGNFIVIVCFNCQKPFEYFSYPSKPIKKFCSIKCYGQYQKGKTLEERYGVKKAKETKDKIKLTKSKTHEGISTVTHKLYPKGIYGRRPDLNNQFFRSTWEANFARICNLYGTKWEYEPKKFWLPELEAYYYPDFYLPEINIYIEITGWENNLKKLKLESFAKNYPNISIIHIIGEIWYKYFRPYSLLLKEWEYSG
jgi:endogenous inhibitor of DNA gyrase (YacG/DUF329 family)